MTDSRASPNGGRSVSTAATRAGSATAWRRLRAWWRKSARPFWRDFHWIAIGVAAVAAVGLGYWGFDRHLDATGESHSVGDTLYRSLALFAFEGGAVEPPVPWQLEVARILAPLVAVYAAVRAVAALLSQQLQLLRVRRMRKHVVVCGLGARGLLLAKGFNARGDRVVAIEENEGAAGIGECREEGIAVLIGDSTDRTMLGKARAGEARYLIAVGPDDGVNAEIAADLPELVPEDRRGVLTAFLHVIDPNLCGLLRQREIASPIAASYSLEFFSVYEIAARTLVSQYLPRHGANGPGQAPEHMVVVGLGQLGEALVVHAARAWHATRGASGPPLGLTIVDQAARRKCESLLLRYPQLGTVCELTDPSQTEVEIKDPAFHRAEFLRLDRPRAASVIYVCVDDDALGLYAAQALLPKVRERNVPIVVRMRQHAGLATLLGEKAGAGGRAGGLRAFPLLDRTCTPEVLLDGTRELLARIIHADYVRHQRERGETPETKPSVADWEELDERYRDSSRRQADHIGVKLRAVDCGIDPLTDWDADLVEFSPAEVERLAEMEHDRFVAERFREGWKLGRGPSDPESKTNPYLVSWGELEDDVKGWDRNTVSHLPRFLAEAGFRVYRLQEPLAGDRIAAEG